MPLHQGQQSAEKWRFQTSGPPSAPHRPLSTGGSHSPQTQAPRLAHWPPEHSPPPHMACVSTLASEGERSLPRPPSLQGWQKPLALPLLGGPGLVRKSTLKTGLPEEAQNVQCKARGPLLSGTRELHVYWAFGGWHACLGELVPSNPTNGSAQV